MACMTKYRCKLHLQVTLIQIKHANLNSLKWNLHSDTILPGQMSSQIRFQFEMVHKQKHQDLNPQPKILISRQEEVSTGFCWKHGNKNWSSSSFRREHESSQLTELSEMKTSQSNFSFKIIFLKTLLLFWVLEFF